MSGIFNVNNNNKNNNYKKYQFENYENSDTISAGKRAGAIENGGLIDISDTDEAKEVGIKLSIAVTSSLWTKYIKWTKEDRYQTISPEAKSRLRDILRLLAVWMKYHEVAQTDLVDKGFSYEVCVISSNDMRMKIEIITLKAVFSLTNDNSKSMITIMLESEF